MLFSGFHMGDTHAGVSNLRYGLDGWVYATIGYSGFDGLVGEVHHRFSQGVFRFRPDGSALEFLQNTTNNTWGLGFTEAGDVVGSTANGNPSFYLTFPNREAYERCGVDQPRTPNADDNPMFFPMSEDIRQVDQFDRFTARRGPRALHRAPVPAGVPRQGRVRLRADRQAGRQLRARRAAAPASRPSCRPTTCSRRPTRGAARCAPRSAPTARCGSATGTT